MPTGIGANLSSPCLLANTLHSPKLKEKQVFTAKLASKHHGRDLLAPFALGRLKGV